MKPFLSICIPNYNHGSVLRETLVSVIDQNLEGIEVLISDNASTDNSLNVIKPFRTHPNIRVLEQQQTVPMSKHWNLVVQAASADWVLVLSSDDVLLPKSLAILKAHLKPNVGAVFFEYDFLGLLGRVTKCPFYRDSAIIPGKEQSKIFLKGNNFPLSACVFRRNIFEQLGGFDETKVFCTDWHAWLGLSAKAAQVIYIKQPLLLYRQHDANETHRCIENLSALSEVISMKQDFISKQNITDSGILFDAINNNLKLAKIYRQKVKARELEHEYQYYQNQVKLLTERLSELKTITHEPSVVPLSPPYPLPIGSEVLDIDNLALT